MCVIIASNKKKVPIDWLDKAAEKNSDGNGLAWIENGKVQFVKSMALEPIKAIYERIEPPYVFHARIATQGGKSLKLCHPFPVDINATLMPRGSCDAVFFHNGNHHKWNEMCRDAVLRHRLRWPSGPWSDSRAMAWLCYHFGLNFADLLDQKIAILTTKKVKIYGSGWDEEDGVFLSNKFFLSTATIVGYTGGQGYKPTEVWDSTLQKYVPWVAKEEKCLNEFCFNGYEWNQLTRRQEPCEWCCTRSTTILD